MNSIPERIAALVAVLLCAVPSALAAQRTTTSLPTLEAGVVDTLAIRAHTRFLADDLLTGRGAGTEGERLAAVYIESQLMRLGLEPVGATYHHPIPLVSATMQAGTTLLLEDGRTFDSPTDFVWNTGGAGAFRDFEGRAVFAGAPEEAFASLRGHDVRGATIVVLGLLGASATQLVPDWIERGAAGVIVLAPDSAYFELVARSRGDVRYFVDAPLNDPVWQPDLPVVVAGPRLSAALFESVTGGIADAALPLDLGTTVAATVVVHRQPAPSANVAGMVAGADPSRRNEFVVYTAHYDHLGISVPDAAGDSIYNGFSDNAAGVAMLLAIAKRFAAEPPPVSVLFLFFTAEERGLLGSSYFAATPPIPLAQIRGVINLDAGAPPAPPVSWRIAAGENAANLAELARDVASGRGWRTDVGAATPNSDHWPFAARGVPAIFIIPGADWEGTTADEARALRARWDRYHQAGDHWHPEFPFSGLGRYADYALEIGRRLAAAP